MTMDATEWERLLEMGSINEICIDLMEIAADSRPGDELLYCRLKDALEAMCERGLANSKSLCRQADERMALARQALARLKLDREELERERQELEGPGGVLQ